MDGYKAISVFSLNGFRSIEKGHRTAQSILSRFSTKLEVAHLLLILTSCYRVRNIFKKVGFEDFTRVHMQVCELW